MNNSVVIFTGGTGGHVLPSVNFGNYLIDHGFDCILFSDVRGEKYTKEFLGRVKIVNSSHLTGGIFFKFLGIAKLFLGFIHSLFLLTLIKPRVAVSFGSYASLPPCFAVKILKIIYKINFYIHEQNSIIGKSNKFFINQANKFFVNFDKEYKLEKKYQEKIRIVGLPNIKYKKEINDLNILNKINKKFVLFLYGGSQGSIALLKCLEKILKNLNPEELKDIFFIIQCPDFYFNELKYQIKKYNISYEIKNYYYNLPQLLEKIDLIISRCGAGTINDIINYKVPSILIPLPKAKENHQYENATFLLGKTQNAIILDQNNFDLIKALNFIKKNLRNNYKKKIIEKKINNKNISNANKLMMDIINNEVF